MCRRSGGSVYGTLISILFFFKVSAPVQAQELPESVTALIEQLAEQGSDAEELVRYYEGLLHNPLNLNAASRAQLEETGLLTLFQVESLLAWRERYGAVRSAAELALVEGFSPEESARLRPFFFFGEPSAVRRTEQTYTVRLRKKWKQEGFSLTTKGLYESDFFSAGALVDNDPKERFPDFVSLTARYKGLYAGDFTARFGQGLVLWKAFNLSAFGTPSGMSRRGGGLQPYHSTDEANFFRGAGYVCEKGRIRVSALVSYNALDARVVGDSCYTSIVTGGLHVTEAERAKRHTLHEFVAGANASLTLGRWRLGVTGAAYRYDKRNARRVLDYNRLQQYDGWWGNLGFDWYGSLGSLRLFGEAAIDAHGAPAALAGVLWSPSFGFETSLLVRCYSPAYIATHAGAWSSAGNVSNQLGAVYALQAVLGRWTLRFNADYAWYPWYRYRMDAGTSGFKARFQLIRTFSGGAEGECQLAWSSRLKGRLRLTLPFASDWQVSLRADANRGGAAGYADLRWAPSRRWDVSARATLWQTADWDSRICFYERGVPQSFPVENYAGKGIGAYLVVKYAPTRNVELWIKIQQGYCAYFMRIFIPG